jgi:hypothetical protein
MYYFAKSSTDNEVIGHGYTFPQLKKMFDGFNIDYPKETFGVEGNRRLLPMEKATGFVLKHHTKVTDWISGANVGYDEMLISERFYHLLAGYNCLKMIVVDSEVTHHAKTFPYKYIFCPESQEHTIDFERSIIEMKDNNKNRISTPKFKDFDEYNQWYAHQNTLNREASRSQQYHLIRYAKCSTVFFNEQTELDFFRLSGIITPVFVVSSRLKKAIDQAGITGLNFISAQGFTFKSSFIE